jgi:GNAT superfamily N-acetyltransferase
MATITTIDDLPGLRAIAATLPDTPETVISLHTLQRGLCRAYIVGLPEQYDALVIVSDDVPGEPSCYGAAVALWSVLRDLPGWFAANMREDVAPAFGAHVRRDWGDDVTYYGDPHFTLQQPAPDLPNPDVRLLTLADLPLLDAAPAEVRGTGFGGTRALLGDGIVAAAVVNNAVVAIAHTSAITDLHADIGVSTLEPFRGRGYASAAAALVARAIQATGRIPVWSCGETNEASLRTAQKLGFEPALRRVYVIVESRR